jgi:succinyl-CoA synthetase alpha subunit
VCITEGIPVMDMVKVRRALETGSEDRLVGPNCPGVITPGECKIGIMPGHIHKPGKVGVVSRSGTLTYEAVGQLTALGIGSRPASASAATRSTAPTSSTCSEAVQRRPDTDGVIMIGEIGGSAESGRRVDQGQHEEAGRGLHRGHHGAAGQAHGPRRRDHLGRQGHRGREDRHYEDEFTWPLLEKRSPLVVDRNIETPLETVSWSKEDNCTCVSVPTGQ